MLMNRALLSGSHTGRPNPMLPAMSSLTLLSATLMVLRTQRSSLPDCKTVAAMVLPSGDQERPLMNTASEGMEARR